ncbi:helix-turn-helix transcriptional regulator [Rhizobium sp. RAF56]|uniref:helix-turn-helix transcriptional regulator n=1 Tax=Rhizobium sp. RAF56 TaxID=3233062 RepID=UPI003F97483B
MTKLEPILVRQAEAAKLLAVSERTLEAWRAQGKGPPWLRIGEGRGKGVRYAYAQLRQWAEKQIS